MFAPHGRLGTADRGTGRANWRIASGFPNVSAPPSRLRALPSPTIGLAFEVTVRIEYFAAGHLK